jgi:hypothetical protein
LATHQFAPICDPVEIKIAFRKERAEDHVPNLCCGLVSLLKESK